MRRHPHTHSRLFRCLLVLAMLAWVGLAFDAVAHPLMMAMPDGSVSMTMGEAAPHGDHMTSMATSHVGHHHAPLQPVGSGHGCCQHGSCHCPTLCSPVMGVACFDLSWQHAHHAAIPVVHSMPVLARSVPPFRPPIA